MQVVRNLAAPVTIMHKYSEVMGMEVLALILHLCLIVAIGAYRAYLILGMKFFYHICCHEVANRSLPFDDITVFMETANTYRREMPYFPRRILCFSEFFITVVFTVTHFRTRPNQRNLRWSSHIVTLHIFLYYGALVCKFTKFCIKQVLIKRR